MADVTMKLARAMQAAVAAGESSSSVAARFGVSRATVSRYAPRTPCPKHGIRARGPDCRCGTCLRKGEAETAQAAEVWRTVLRHARRGVPYAELSATYGVSVAAIRYRVRVEREKRKKRAAAAAMERAS